MFDVKYEVLKAEEKIRPYIRETPLDYSLALSKAAGCNVYLKCENLQYTGAFKVRGAFNKLLNLTPMQRLQGVATASSGNHGTAVAYGLYKLAFGGIVFVPENASLTKVDAIRRYEIPLDFFGVDCVLAEAHARAYAKQRGIINISPYNDPEIVAGQGTIGIELLRQLEKIDVILVPVGGGGLIAGIAGYIKACSPTTKIIGCMPENSPVMAESIKAGHIVEMETKPTLSDATAGGIEAEAITFELCQKYVDDYILVSETEIKNAITGLLSTHHLLVEGASGVALASLMKNADQFKNKNVAVILSGANIGLETLKSLL